MKYVFCLLLILVTTHSFAQKTENAKRCNVLAYYTGDSSEIDRYNVSQLTHIIFSFTHLNGNELHLDKAKDTATIQKLVSLKQQYSDLKIMFSMGGWGGCEQCSQVFNTKKGRRKFASSSKHLLKYFGADGIDLDWEYPAIEGFPGHQYLPEDKQSFTALIKQLRKRLKSKYEISFAAGGFTEYIQKSVEWDKISPLLNHINLMTYDLVNGYAKVSGHHTPLFSTPQQRESIDHAIHMLDSLGVPKNKIDIGAAFYARIFKLQDSLQNGLYQTCTFYKGLDYKHFDDTIKPNPDYVYYWDSVAHAPYYYNAKDKLLVSFDDSRSMAEKTQYAIDHGLDGIMFWELTNDVYTTGLLQAIDEVRKETKHINTSKLHSEFVYIAL